MVSRSECHISAARPDATWSRRILHSCDECCECPVRAAREGSGTTKAWISFCGEAIPRGQVERTLTAAGIELTTLGADPAPDLGVVLLDDVSPAVCDLLRETS